MIFEPLWVSWVTKKRGVLAIVRSRNKTQRGEQSQCSLCFLNLGPTSWACTGSCIHGRSVFEAGETQTNINNEWSLEKAMHYKCVKCQIDLHSHIRIPSLPFDWFTNLLKCVGFVCHSLAFCPVFFDLAFVFLSSWATHFQLHAVTCILCVWIMIQEASKAHPTKA